MKYTIRFSISLLLAWLMIANTGLFAQNVNKQNFPVKKSANRVELALPQVNGYTLLRCDFHTHTVFSDGLVWPTFRVYEAWKGGLDVLAITDHIENRTYKKYTGDDLNASYEIALPVADELGIMLVRGTEITRKQGVLGHFNGLFIKDANPINNPDPELSIKTAWEQGAYITYNHPAWALDTCLLTDFQNSMIDKGYVKGIEVFNNDEYYPRALSWCIDKGLGVFSASDVHACLADDFGIHGSGSARSEFRPMTFVFVKEKSLDAVKDAMFKGLTLAYFDGNVAGAEKLLASLFLASIKVEKVSQTAKQISYRFSNISGIPYKISIDNKKYTLDGKSAILINLGVGLKSVDCMVENMHYYEFKHPVVQLSL
ncbi:MAG: phosphotransferase [Bacteroidales bacterium]